MASTHEKAPLRAWLARCGAVALLALLSACGGGSGGGAPALAATAPMGAGTGTGTDNSTQPVPAAANVVAIAIDSGTDGSAVNAPFVTVTICVPGTQSCQAVDHVLVDTGSYGLRIAAAALTTVPAANFPAVNAASGAPLAECAGFASGYAWGSVRTADLRIGGEAASDVPVQIVDDSGAPYATVPGACSRTGPVLGVGAGAHGILGVGFLKQDCGTACAGGSAPTMYFACPASGCVASPASLESQVTNPVALFAADNNGVAIVLPPLAPGGAPSLAGSLVFGVGTQSNNLPGSAAVYAADSQGNFSTTYRGSTVRAFIDSGSNGIFFHDSTIPVCGRRGFYCPASPLSLSATVSGANGASRSVAFQVESPNNLPASAAVALLGGQLGGSFDWGLPFFFGRTVFVAMKGAPTPAGDGPYWAF